jgi:hypothetical protein
MRTGHLIPAARKIDSSIKGRAADILSVSRAAPSFACSVAPPTPRAYQPALRAAGITRRFVLLLPLALAACGEEPEPVYEPLRYNYLPPLQLNVAGIEVEQRFIPAGILPDVSNQDPVPPIDALAAMGHDRLQAFGTANKAVFAIMDATMTRENDTVIGSFAVSLTILDDSGAQTGFAEARVQSTHTGRIEALRPVLYDMTTRMMSDMNVEFEYQIRRNLKAWLTNGAAPDTPVEQAPLEQPPLGQPPLGQPPLGQPPLGQPPLGQPPR